LIMVNPEIFITQSKDEINDTRKQNTSIQENKDMNL
jgi:hypothetical protein